jgi:hypothetical protein
MNTQLLNKNLQAQSISLEKYISYQNIGKSSPVIKYFIKAFCPISEKKIQKDGRASGKEILF